jgi:hypothetical protein
MNTSIEDNFDAYFIKFVQHVIQMKDDKHAEWVLFRHGSLYSQTMPNNIETLKDELIEKAKESLSEVCIAPGCSYGDITTYSLNYENDTIYFGAIETFHGIIIVHPSKNVSHHLMAIMHTRMNVLDDQHNPIVIATGNTKGDLIKLTKN